MGSNPPDRIFLQFDEDDVPETFCVDKINERDVEYVRFGAIKDAVQPLLESLEEVLPTAKKAVAFQVSVRDALARIKGVSDE